MSASHRPAILVVDDTPDTVRLLTAALEAAGMDVLVALDGAAALQVASRATPDLVLMDALMPGLDGFETCRRLKALSGFDAVPVIFMTGMSEVEDSLRGFAAGAADYVTKPLILDAMLARINAHLTNARKIRDARLALDAADQALIATDASGAILWFTPQAYRLLEERFHDAAAGDLRLPAAVVDWLVARAADAPGEGARSSFLDVPHGHEDGRSRITFVRGTREGGEILFRIADSTPRSQADLLSKALGLTPREAEVAYWMAGGKSNRDIATILSLSPRTIDKHLEVIFTKLNVENRTTAAAAIIGLLPR